MQADYCAGSVWGGVIFHSSWCGVGVGFVLEIALKGNYSPGFHAASHVGQHEYSM